MLKPALKGVVGDTQIGDRMTPVRMVTRHIPHHRTAPIMADPDGFFLPERVYQLQHVADDLLLGVIAVLPIHRRAAIAAHVRRYGPKPQRS